MIAIFLLIILSSAHSKTCNEASTVRAGCTTCNIDEVIRDQGGLKIVPNQIEPRPDVNGCTSTYFRCYNEDYSLCDSVTAYADTVNNGTMIPIGVEYVTVAEVTVTCGDDGRYTWEDVKGIEAIYCIYVNCV